MSSNPQMLSRFDSSRINPGSTPKPRFFDGLAKRTLLQCLSRLKDGQIVLIDGDVTHRFGQCTARCSIQAELHVVNSKFYRDAAFGGGIGVAEAYMSGYWYTDDLVALVRVMACNLDVVDSMESRLSFVTNPLQRFFHWSNRNTPEGSKRNIAAHYDLGNDFFQQMLDSTMMYSSAIFAQPEMGLYEAQTYRLELMCQKLELKPSDHLLEIGTGWGGFALYAAQHYGCRVTTTTISREQYELACQRVLEAGLERQVTVLFEDYRDLEGSFDKLISIEMIEAIGREHYTTYFKKCNKLLKSKGLMLIQAITIDDQRYAKTSREVDFIKRYIFPGGCLPSVTVMQQHVTEHSNMRLNHLEDIGSHYAITLQQWRHNIAKNLSEIKALGYSDTFLRMWHFYLCYCEAGFRERTIGTVQMLLAQPDYRCASTKST